MGSYSGSLTVALPGVVEGNYNIIVVTDSRLNVPDNVRANNTRASSNLVAIDIQDLAFGATVGGMIDANEDIYYKVNVTTLVDLKFQVSQALSSQAEFYVSYSSIPTRANYDYTTSNIIDLFNTITVASPQFGNFYVLIHGRQAAASGHSYTIRVDQIALGITSAGPNRGSNVGSVTTTIKGSGFTPDTVIKLKQGAVERTAAQLVYQSTNQVQVLFDLTGLATGSYDIVAQNSADTTTLPGGFTVTNGVAGKLEEHISTPGSVRPGQSADAIIEYKNVGETNIPAQLLNLFGGSVKLQIPGQTDEMRNFLPVFATNPNGPAGVLPPGFVGRVTVKVTPTGPSGTDLHLVIPAGSEAIDWDLYKNSLRPSGMSDDAWDAIYANFKQDIGTTYGQYNIYMANIATYLGQLGIHTNDPARLKQYAIEHADGFGAISNRYKLTSSGRGRTDEVSIKASTDAIGNVVISYGGQLRGFTKLSNGSYLGDVTDNGSLKKVGNHYELLELNGQRTVFLDNGNWSFVETLIGHKSTVGYSGDLVTSVTQSNGDVTNYQYNAQGRLIKITDPVGRVFTYTYDPLNEHLLSYTTPAGTESYTYVTGQGAAREHAIASITLHDGSVVNFSYDNRGRVTEVRRNGNLLVTKYSYDEFGKVTITTPDGKKTSAYFSDLGNVERLTDAEGATSNFDYELDGDLSKVSGQGFTSTFTSDSKHSPVRNVNPTGATAEFLFDPKYGSMLTSQDGNGRIVQIERNSKDQVTAVTYDNGDQAKFEYDSRGNLIENHAVNGDTILYKYDSKDLLLQVSYTDGSFYKYSYDARRNLESITESTGITRFTYDARNRVTSVTYPNGRSLSYQYDAANRRTQISDQSGFAQKYGYDPLGRLSTVRDANDTLMVSYTYNINGRVERETKGNGTYTTYTYVPAGGVASIIHYTPNNSILDRFDYIYDAKGRPTSVTTLIGTTSYEYDGTNQLVKVTLPNSRVINYEYDSNGNRISVIDNGAPENYSTNNLNQYLQVGNATYTYDLNGNIRTKTDSNGVTNYSYDIRGRLIEVINPTDSWQFEYSVLGHRTASIHNGVRTEYLVDFTGVSNVWAEFDGANAITAHYVKGLGLVTRVDGTGTPAYYGYDMLGNTSIMTNSSGAVVNSYSYLPFGEKLTNNETISNSFTFVGRDGVMEEGSGLYFMRRRFYEPSIGRFISRDPIGMLGGSLNLYEYAVNEPTLKTDPSGLQISPPNFNALTQNLPNPDTAFDKLSRYWNALADTVSELRNGAAELNGKPDPSGFRYGAAYTKDGVNSAKDLLKGLEDMGAGSPALRAEVEDAISSAEKALAENAAREALKAKVVNGVRWGGIIGTIGSIFVDPNIARYWGNNYNNRQKYLPDRLAGKDARIIPDEDIANKAFLALICNSAAAATGLTTTYLVTISGLAGPPGWIAGLVAAGGGFLSATAIKWLCWSYGYVQAVDPNSISGLQGVGPDNHIPADILLPYEIKFENLSTATAPAQTVTITQQLDSDLDLNTFEFGDFGFGDLVVDVPEGRKNHYERIDLSATKGYYVDVNADINLETALVTWHFAAIDPATGDLVTDALAGFLPPNVTSPEGEGFVKYVVRPKAGLATGTRIDAQASIVFDTNDAILTNSIYHTIDAGAPSSFVTALPAQTDSTTFNVSWSGVDDTNGSGVGRYDIYVSDNNGPFVLWQNQVTTTSATFTGVNGHTYRFYSIAEDRVGLIEDAPATFDAITEVAIANLTTDVTVTVNGNNLLIEGNSVSNHILITKGATANQVILTGLFNSDRGENSTINGLNSMTFNNVTGTITVNMFEGNDEVEIRNIIHQGSVAINAGIGNDKVTLGRKFALTQSDPTAYTRIIGVLMINGDDGNDTITLGRVYGYGVQTINGGNDTDTISIYVDFAGVMNISGDNGNDDIQVGYLTANQTLTMNGNQGNDLVTLYGSRAVGEAFFYGGTGLDTIALDVNRYDSNVTVDAGADADTLLFARSILALDAVFSTGAGSDTVLFGKYYGRNASNQIVLLNGGSSAKKVTINTGSLNDSIQSATNRLEQFFADLGGGNDSLDSLNDFVSLRYEWNGNNDTDRLTFAGINEPLNGKSVTNFEP